MEEALALDSERCYDQGEARLPELGSMLELIQLSHRLTALFAERS